MEFEQYLEKDILNFLDSKMERKKNNLADREDEYGIYLTRDYLKELNYALDNDELTKAKKLFDELKSNFSRLPKSSAERKKIYSLLEKMYDKIQNYVKIKEGSIEVIKQGESEVQKDRSEKFKIISENSEVKVIEQKMSSPEKIPEQEIFMKIMEMPINMNMVEHPGPSQAEHESSKQKKRHGKDIAVESNIFGNTMKDLKAGDSKTAATKGEGANISAGGSGEGEGKHHGGKHHDESAAEKMPQDMAFKYHETESGRHKVFHGLKDDAIYETAEYIEKLKTHVTEGLLKELRKLLDEKSDSQDKKIEALRKNLVDHMMKELNKRLNAEKHEVSEKIGYLRSEILDGVYTQARQIVSLDDNHKNIVMGKHHIHQSYGDEGHKEMYDEDESGTDVTELKENIDEHIENFAGSMSGTQDEHETSGFRPRYRRDEEEMQKMYEQAIYTMFQNNYNEAAEMFKQILRIRPENKAARIRLQECMEGMGDA